MRALEVQIRWVPVRNRDGNIWTFPDAFPDEGRYLGPSVYRWVIRSADQDEAEFLQIYVGQSQSLSERVCGVFSLSASNEADKGTNGRLNAIFREAVSSGNVVNLETAFFGEFSFNGVVFSPDDLFHPFKRCALENLFLSCSLALGKKLLNRCVDPDERCEEQLREFTKSPRKVEEMMKICAPSRNSEEVRRRFFETDEEG